MLTFLKELGLVKEEPILDCGICECGNWDHDHAYIEWEWNACMAINLKTGRSCQCRQYKKWMGGDNCANLSG